jgi:hypothetical protein
VEVESYRRRRPEETVLYKVVRENLATFLEVADLRSGGKGLPAYVRQEFERYLDCGILANGFARVRCADCGHDEVVAFSCRGRGFCPSCMGRRMADTAAYLVDRVLPQVPIRQWVLSFPWQVRLHLARDSRLLTRAITVFMEEVFRHYEREFIYAQEDLEPGKWRRRRSLRSAQEVAGGAVTAVQRFGSSLNLNVHLHTLALDGVYWREPQTSKIRFFEAAPPTPEALQEVAGLGLSGAQRFAGLALGNHWRAFAIASGQDIAVAAAELFGGGFIQATTSLDGGVVNFQQQQTHLQRPPLAVLLGCAFEFAQVMRVAEEVQAVELKVGFPVVVTQTSVKVF